ncbi:MAG TPA: redoxin domain-containing protein [Pirellulaceae bacterium]|nr:redoxin domain-containing protein [Pirellulaceae bacterium]HMO94070.1 redoxin domain-containing protein [Pirellulaceae bacterium]HMP70922.1 redoxin domain-containing protein [Pirellulaceae bacterium]
MQLGQLRSKLKQFSDLNTVLLAVDPHDGVSARYLLKEAGATTDDLDFSLLLDPAFVASSQYGVSFQMRIHTEWSNRPATFVIDKSGILRFAQRAETFNDRPSPDQLIELIRGLE